MTQTTAGLSFTAAQVWISDDVGVGWIDLGPHFASVAVSGGERATGEQNTGDGTLPIVKGGDRASTDVTVRFVYTEGADPEPFETLRAVHEGATGAIEMQYAVSGGASEVWFHADEGSILTNLSYPGGEAGDGAVVMCEFVVKCAALTKAAASIAAG